MPSLSGSPASILPRLPRGARILILRLRSLGDAILTTPALCALKQWRPDLRLSMVLYRQFAPVLAGNPNLEEVIEFEPGALTLPRLLSALRRRRFAACFNLHGGTLSALVARLSGAPHRVGYARSRFEFVYTATCDPRRFFGRERRHAVENQIALFYAAGLPQGEIPPLELHPQPEARAAVTQKLARRGLAAGRRYAVLHPVANFFTKEWPLDRYAALARWLEEEHGLAPVLVGAAGEGARLEAVAHACAKAPVRLEGLPLQELTALIEAAAVFIGNDSGPAHIAAALGRPTVVLFGSSDSEAWRPWSPAPLTAVVQNPYPCNPCKGDRCYAFAQPECILSITLPQVQAAVERLLAPVSVRE